VYYVNELSASTIHSHSETQHLQHMVLCNTRNFPRHTSGYKSHAAFEIHHFYDCITDFTGIRQKTYKMTKICMFAE